MNVAVASPDGSTMYIGGSFSYVGPNTGSGVPINVTTGVNQAVFPKVNGSVSSVVSDGSGGWYIGGSFSKVGSMDRNNIAHILSDGSVDAWDPNANSDVWALAVSGSTVYAGGSFTSLGGQTRNYIAALDTTTGLATAWDPNADSAVYALAVSGSTVYAGGSFTSLGGQNRNYIAALDTTTGLATAWDPNANSDVYALAVSGSTVYAGGVFTSLGGQNRNRVAAIDTTTGVATAWDPNADGVVSALAVSGSTVYAGGTFTSLGGQNRNRVAAIDTTTGLATAWDPNADSDVYALAVSGSTVYAGGTFTSLGGVSQRSFAQFDYPGITLTPSGGTTTITEGGATDTYTVVLNSEPTANVVVTPSPNAQVSVAPPSLTFTSVNWNTPQTITVTAVDDAVVEGSHTGTITHAATSVDANYDAISLASVSATITDNDTAGGGGGGGLPSVAYNLPVAPVGGFTTVINNGNQTTSNRIVNLNLNAGYDVKKVAVSFTPDFSESSLDEYSPTKQVDLCSKFGGVMRSPTCPDGQYTVYVKFYTSWGRSSDPIPANISLVTPSLSTATTPPTVTKPISPSTTTPTLRLTTNLRLGSRGSQVKLLQQILNQKGYIIAKSGIGSPGNETPFFGLLTRLSLIKFQKANNISPAVGYVGPITRDLLNQTR